jgi:SAM-dependent methyltransferase
MTKETRKSTIAAERLDRKEFVPPWTVKEHKERYEFAARYCNGLHVCDCACGAGMGTKRYQKAGALSVIGVDAAGDAINATPRLEKVTYIEASAENLPFGKECFDLIVSLETIEHVEDPKRTIGEFGRCLKPNGRLVISTPNRLVTNPGLPPEGKPWNPYHIREFTPTESTNLVSSHFHKLQTFGQNPIKPTYLRLKNTLANRFGTSTSVLMGQIAKCFWPILKPRDFHKVKRSTLDLVEYMIIVANRK